MGVFPQRVFFAQRGVLGRFTPYVGKEVEEFYFQKIRLPIKIRGVNKTQVNGNVRSCRKNSHSRIVEIGSKHN